MRCGPWYGKGGGGMCDKEIPTTSPFPSWVQCLFEDYAPRAQVYYTVQNKDCSR